MVWTDPTKDKEAWHKILTAERRILGLLQIIIIRRRPLLGGRVHIGAMLCHKRFYNI